MVSGAKSPRNHSNIRIKSRKVLSKGKLKRSCTYRGSSHWKQQPSLYEFSDAEEDLVKKSGNLTMRQRIKCYLSNVLRNVKGTTHKYFFSVFMNNVPRRWYSDEAPRSIRSPSVPLREVSNQQQQPLPNRQNVRPKFLSDSVPLKNGTAASANNLNGSVCHSENSNLTASSRKVNLRSVSYAQESVKLMEEDKYKQLLQQYTKESIRESGPRRTVSFKDAQSQAQPETPAPTVLLKRPLLPLNSVVVDYRPRNLPRQNAPVPFNSGYNISPSSHYKPPPLKVPPNSSYHHIMDEKFQDNWVKNMRASLDASTAERKKRVEACENTLREHQKKREAKYAELERKMKEVLSRKYKSLEEEEEEPYFRELTAEMEAQIEDALTKPKPDHVLVEGFRLSISRKDMETLTGLSWLNDEIINFYMNLLMERSKAEDYPTVYAFNTFFYTKLVSGGHAPLRRWTRKVDIFSFDLLLVPVHMESHWCLAVIDFRTKQLKYYDSLGGKNQECLMALAKYLQEESVDKKKVEYDMGGWAYEFVKDIPLQMNGSDCGMFALKYAEYITRDAKINFSQAHMPYFRRRMMYEILTKTLL